MGSEKMLNWAKKMHMRPTKKRKLFSDGAENKQQLFFFILGAEIMHLVRVWAKFMHFVCA